MTDITERTETVITATTAIVASITRRQGYNKGRSQD
jgi:hypothetical protein